MRQVVLRARTHKADNRLREIQQLAPEWDRTWIVQEEHETVIFAGGEKGPWLYVKPACPLSRDLARWVHATNDKDFEVEAS